MGQKINLIRLRVGIIRDWEAKWYAEKNSASLLHEDLKIRKLVDSGLKEALVPHVEIKRAANRIGIAIRTDKPNIVIDRDGLEIEKLRNKLSALTGKEVHINVVEIKEIDPDARLVTENIVRQLGSRVSFRRIQRQAVIRATKLGAKSIRTQVSGRLDGADIARAEQYSEGTVPLHTLCADINYTHTEADTTYDELGIKVWIYRGEVLPTKNTSGGGK